MSYRILYHHRIRADDGQAVHVRELIAAFRRAGHQVHECALVKKSESHPGANQDKHGFWRKLQLPRIAVELMEMLYSRHGARLLIQQGRQFRPDFIYERHALHCKAGLTAARTLGVPLLLEVNSPMCDEMARLRQLRFARLAQATERAVLQGADRVLAVTSVLRRRLLQLGAVMERTLVVPNGVDLSRHPVPSPGQRAEMRARLQLSKDTKAADDPFVVTFVGYMRPWHRLDLMLEVMCRKGLEQISLLLLGDGPALQPTLEQAERLGLQQRVRSLGVVAADDLPGHLAASDAALIPAINAYASPLKLFDSLAAALVTLAPDQENLREYIRHQQNGLLFEPGNADALATQLSFLVIDRERARALGAAGRQSLLDADWTWDGNARRVTDAFLECR